MSGSKGGGSRGKRRGSEKPLTADSVDEIIDTIESNEDEFRYFGLRSMTQNPETGEFEVAKVGDTLNESFEWDDGYSTGNELGGTSAFQISGDRGEIEHGIREINQTYAPISKQIVLVGSDHLVEYGNDPGEIVIRNPVVLKTWVVK
jgi:hypothetical protein